jgi:DNA polymerase I
MPTYEELLSLPSPLDPQRLLLIDGHSLAYRAYYGMPQLTTQQGTPVGAVYGFWRAILAMMRRHPCLHMAVAFDAGGRTFRDELYEAYKANRSLMPEDLQLQIPLIERLLSELGIPVFVQPEVEADDVIASLARQSAQRGLWCLIASSDKDLAQLVNERVSLLRPAGRGAPDALQLLDADAVKERYGVPPERVADLLSLMGDSSDNIPGVPGVGEKTARKLLQQFGTLEGVLASADRVGNQRIAEHLITHADKARLARELVRLREDLDVGDVLSVCQLRGSRPEGLSALFSELGFLEALDELGLDSQETTLAPRDGADDAEYITVLGRDGLKEALEEIGSCSSLSVDLETTGRDPHTAEIVGIALSSRPLRGYYIPVGHRTLDAPGQMELSGVLDALRPILEAESPEIIGQNLKYDLILFRRHGVHPRGIRFDAMIASHLTQPEERRHNLERIVGSVLGHAMTRYGDLVGKDETFADVPLDRATAYAAQDAEIIQRLRPPLQDRLAADHLRSLFDDVEMPLVSVLATMESNGILLDKEVLAKQGCEIRREMEILESDLFDLVGEPFNPNSPKQVAEILFGRLGLPVVSRTKTGPSTSAQVLLQLAQQHPFPGKLMAHRELQKLLTTYIEQLPKSVHPLSGRIHSSFHQTSTATGRLSSSDPNLQNIPTRTEVGGRIRCAFVAEAGHLFLAADYSQIELRLLAHFSQDESLIGAFESGTDLHRRTASRVFGLPEDRIPHELREAAKRINFGILYGISPFGLARDLGIPQSEARTYIDRFFDAYPQAKQCIDQMVETATKKGWAETLLGRRRPLPGLTSRNAQQRNFDRRNAVNTPIQGSAADLIKVAMIRIDARLRSEFPSVRLTLQIHDELVFEVPVGISDPVAEMVAQEMENVHPLNVPLTIKMRQGENWGAL